MVIGTGAGEGGAEVIVRQELQATLYVDGEYINGSSGIIRGLYVALHNTSKTNIYEGVISCRLNSSNIEGVSGNLTTDSITFSVEPGSEYVAHFIKEDAESISFTAIDTGAPVVSRHVTVQLGGSVIMIPLSKDEGIFG